MNLDEGIRVLAEAELNLFAVLVTTAAQAPSPCINCTKKPCLESCPAGAVRMDKMDIDACIHHCLQPESSCTDRCISRVACPYAPEHRYLLPQIRYRYLQFLATPRALYEIRSISSPRVSR